MGDTSSNVSDEFFWAGSGQVGLCGWGLNGLGLVVRVGLGWMGSDHYNQPCGQMYFRQREDRVILTTMNMSKTTRMSHNKDKENN